jgi:hypothetical protein
MSIASRLLTLVLVCLLVTASLSARSGKKTKRQVPGATSTSSFQIDDDEDLTASSLASGGSTDVTKLSGYLSIYGLYLKLKEFQWKRAVISVYNMTIYPNNEYYIRQFLAKGSTNLNWLPNVLNPNACARVHPFGDHCGALSIAEYYYGLTPNTLLFETPTVFIHDFDMTRFFVDVGTRTAFSTIQYRIGTRTAPASTWINATQIGTFRFDENDKIIETDLWNPFYSTRIRESRVREAPDYQFNLANYTCYRHNLYCQRTPYKQYDDWNACMKFLMRLPLGEPDVFTGNNTICRHQHSTLIQLRPEIHCAHLGPGGGGFCQDRPVSFYHTQPLFPHSNRLVAPTKKLN